VLPPLIAPSPQTDRSTDVDASCNPAPPSSSSFPQALEINTTLALGVEVSTKANILGTNLGDIIGDQFQLPNLTALGLFHQFELANKCFDLRSLGIGDPGQQLPVAATMVDGAAMTMTTTMTTTMTRAVASEATSSCGSGSTVMAAAQGPESGLSNVIFETTISRANIMESFTGTATALAVEMTDGGWVEVEVSVAAN
jgi:hypothetical protein